MQVSFIKKITLLLVINYLINVRFDCILTELSDHLMLLILTLKCVTEGEGRGWQLGKLRAFADSGHVLGQEARPVLFSTPSTQQEIMPFEVHSFTG